MSKAFKTSAYTIGAIILLMGLYAYAFTPDKVEAFLAILSSIIFISAFYKFTN